MHSDACLPNTFIALSTPGARDPAESAGVDLAHPTSMINSAYLRIGVGSLRDGTAIVFIDGIAACPRPDIVMVQEERILEEYIYDEQKIQPPEKLTDNRQK
jgi:hypothetical protein